MIGKNKTTVNLERNENNGEKHGKNSVVWFLVNYLTLMVAAKCLIKNIFICETFY